MDLCLWTEFTQCWETIYDDNTGTLDVNGQVLIPSVNFTCSGSIQSWVFGAQSEGDTDRYSELQIWRPGSEDGVYSKVGTTII